jgi:Protein of unknown function (DUF3015)
MLFNKGRDLMRTITLRVLSSVLVLASIGFGVSGCNTTKATLDTFAKFTSSTSPEEWINGDGIVQEQHKARLFTAVVFENLEQDIARGNGEYLTSLAALMKVPPGEQDEFRARSQGNYPLLFAPDRRTAESMLGILTSLRQAHGAVSR